MGRSDQKYTSLYGPLYRVPKLRDTYSIVDCPDSYSSTQGSPLSDSQLEYNTSFNRAIRNLNIPIGLLSLTKIQPASKIDLLTLRQELEKLRAYSENHIIIGDNSSSGDSLPDFKNSGRYKGDIPASR
jgi:hypothetical protein